MQGLLEDTLTHFSDNMEDSVEQNLHLWAQVQGFQNACLFSGLNLSRPRLPSSYVVNVVGKPLRDIWFGKSNIFLDSHLKAQKAYYRRKCVLFLFFFYFWTNFNSYWYSQKDMRSTKRDELNLWHELQPFLLECEQLNLPISAHELHERTEKRINLSWCHLWNGLAELISLLTKCNGQGLIQKNKRGEGVLLFSPFMFHYYFLHVTKKT
jgi:hypothetical protein